MASQGWRLRAVAALAGLTGLIWSASARAGQPELDAIAAQRGIAAGELTIAASVESPAGSAVRGAVATRRSLSLHGIPVRGAFETAWRAGGHGPEQVVAARYPSAAPQLRPNQRRVELAAARAELASLLRPDQLAQLDELDGELVYLLLLDRPVLAWEFVTPLSLTPTPTRARVWISAATGRVLEVDDLIDYANQTEVFAFNPRRTPEPTQVTLTNIDPAPEPWAEGQEFELQHLSGSRVRVFNCIDEEDGVFAPWRADDDECYPTQRVSADDNGNYFVPLPDVKLDAHNIDPVDLYAELSMYYHAEAFFEFMAELGVDGFPCELSNMVANFHWLEPAPGYPDLPFGPYNNAFYSGQCDITRGPTMLFGQGSAVDFAYDGDVVYHELGHGIVQHLTPEGLRLYRLREDGVLRDARALNEAIADYHSLMITNRPELADYVGFYWPELDRAWIRNAENQRRCPLDMAGQEHNDSEPVTAALWAARKRIGGAKLDPVVLAALPLLAGDASIEEAAAALMLIAAAERDAGVWTDADLELLERTLAARNLLDCPRVVDDPASLKDPRFLYLRANSRLVSPFWPGPVQYRQVIPTSSDNLLISFEVTGIGNSAGQPVSAEVEPRILVKRSSVSADAAIHFEYELVATGYAEDDEEVVDEVREVYGDWDEVYAPTVLSPTRRQVLIRGLEAGEVLHVSFVNLARDIAVVRELRFATIPASELEDGSPSEGEAPEPAQLDDGSPCACASEQPGGSGNAVAVGLLVLAAIGRRRSRRR
jgi:MYXO-CTERM domain-containing protein